uniref:Phosphopyruvate hydratase n=1 Tax=Leishmania guyanensis TaxID=5670 RepID=A0A1E1J4B8_LEIGU|nr:hypothetical protein, conserved [Leishmania guyanensis]
MSGSVSWQRYDNEFNVSGILTEAARACVSTYPVDVKDFFFRYFREAAQGTSVKAIYHNEVLSAAGETAVTFTVELCAGPEISVVTGDLLSCVTSDRDRENHASLAAAEEATSDEDNGYSVIQTTCAAVVAKLLQLGYVEPQREWDSTLGAALSASPVAIGASSIQWALSIMASLVAAKQWRVPLYLYVAALVDDSRSGEPIVGGAHLTPGRAGLSAVSKELADSSAPSRQYPVPQLLVTFLVSSAQADAPDAVTGVRFSHVYVALDVLTGSVDGAYEAERSKPVSGTVLRRRMRRVRKAAHLFLKSHPTSSSVCASGALHWDGAANLADVVKAVTEALSAAQLKVGTEVCVGLSMGASTTRVPEVDAADGGTIKDTAGDCRVLYNLFGDGEPPVTGDQVSEYVKEQLRAVDPDVVQFLEDTHAMEDRAARQRLQMALQDSIVLSDVVASKPEWRTATSSPPDALLVPPYDDAFPNIVINPCDYGTISGFVKCMCAAGADSRRAVTVLVDTAAGDAQTAAHLVDVAIACGASYVLDSAGIFSAHVAAVFSQLASRTDELTLKNMAAPRLPAQRFNRCDWPPLPTAEVAPIRRKGDKRKKDAGKASTKRK